MGCVAHSITEHGRFLTVFLAGVRFHTDVSRCAAGCSETPCAARSGNRTGYSIPNPPEILVSELHKFLSLRTYATFTPAIEELQRRAESLRDEVLDEICGSRVEPREVELAHRLTRRLLDASLTQMKDSARRTRSEEALDHAYQRFLEDLT